MNDARRQFGIVGSVFEQPVLEVDEGFDIVNDVGRLVELLDGSHYLYKIVGEFLVLRVFLGVVDSLPGNSHKFAREFVACDAVRSTQLLPPFAVDPTAEGLPNNSCEFKDAFGGYAAKV